MHGTTKCETCGKEFKWYRAKHQVIPKFCNKVCFDTAPKDWVVARFEKFKTDADFQASNHKRRFEEKVIKKEGCWEWKGCQHHSGYLPFKDIHKKNDFAHRASWRIHNGEIPEGMLILHSCDNKRCTRPDHLFLGTQKENMNDMILKDRGIKGEKHHKRKLTEKDVKEIRNLLKMGVKMTRIAKDFGVTDGAIWFIDKNITWKHVKD